MSKSAQPVAGAYCHEVLSVPSFYSEYFIIIIHMIIPPFLQGTQDAIRDAIQDAIMLVHNSYSPNSPV